MDFTNFLSGLWIPRRFGGPIPMTSLLEATDIVYLPSGGVRGRGGRVKYNAAPLSGSVLALWRHFPRAGAPAFLAAEDTGSTVNLKHDTASNGTFAAITGGGGFATGKRFYFTNWASKNKTFFANGDGLWSYNGVIAAVTQTGVQMTGPYVTVHQARLVSTRSDEINYSVYFSDVDDETKVSAGNQINVSDPQGGSITAIISLAGAANVLVIGKSTNQWVVTGDLQFNPIKARYSEVGIVAPASVAVVNDEKGMPVGYFFVGRGGVYFADGQAPPVKLSEPLESLFVAPDGVTFTTYPAAVGYYHPQLDAYEVKLSPADAHTYVVQRVRAGKSTYWPWSKITNRPLTAAATWDAESDAGQAYLGQSNGYVWRVNYGALDDTTPYTPTIQLPFMLIDGRHRVGRVDRLYADYFGSNVCTVRVRYDNTASDDLVLSVGSAQAIGLQRTRVKTLNYDKSGQYVSTVWSFPQDGPAFELYRIGYDVRLRSRRVWR
jgi:hypothetical protein